MWWYNNNYLLFICKLYHILKTNICFQCKSNIGDFLLCAFHKSNVKLCKIQEKEFFKDIFFLITISFTSSEVHLPYRRLHFSSRGELQPLTQCNAMQCNKHPAESESTESFALKCMILCFILCFVVFYVLFSSGTCCLCLEKIMFWNVVIFLIKLRSNKYIVLLN